MCKPANVKMKSVIVEYRRAEREVLRSSIPISPWYFGYPRKHLLHPDMTEDLLTWTVALIKPKCKETCLVSSRLHITVAVRGTF